ncbi:hypothetical protein BD410DRAFT_650783 [Rickenella mellea]|uniref:DUF6535 domain-containing protein n=1 Tax=Rickenella mellea TaxID=50990 RepID=A0A4Y7PMG1_9AGAM|nr:hypothetical protein BD410DRAFT_650783 [Rickenella mellea]
MATLLRRRDEHDQLNNVSADVEANLNGATQPAISPDSTLEEPGSKIWGPYLELADKYDKDLVHNWRDDMDSLLIFAALFSASVTAFVIESYKTLVQDSGDVTVDVLLQISRQLANVTEAPITMRPPFQPASTDIAINIFWFLSLAFSLACALAAVLVRQWARQYLRFPRKFSSTTEQARARQFLFENMQWWKMDFVVEMIPALLHISLILFFIGLLLFAHTVSVTLAIYLLCFSMISGVAYAFITLTPLIFPGCPYETPFSGFLGIVRRYTIGSFVTMWSSVTMILACFVVSMLSILSVLIKLWSPSYTIPEWKWAVELSEPIRTPLIRHLTRMRRVTPPSGRHTHQVTPRFIQFLSNDQMAFRHLWTSTMSSLILITHSISKSIINRRQSFQNEISMRDAHALHWAMEFTRKDVDLFTIITFVNVEFWGRVPHPAFVTLQGN